MLNLEDLFFDRSLWLSINRQCLLPEMYLHVFTLVRKRGVICAVAPLLIIPIQGVYKTFKHGMFRLGGSCNFPI